MSTSVHRNIPLYFAYQGFGHAHLARGIFVLFLADKGFDWAQIGVLQSALYFANFLAEVPTGILGDKYGRRLSVLAGLGLSVVVCLGQLVCSSFATFLLLFILQGIAFALVSGSDSALFYDSVKASGRTDEYVRLKSRLRALGAGSLATAMLLGGLLKELSWSVVYAGSAVMVLLALGAVVLMREVHHEDEGEGDEPVPGVVESLRVFFWQPVGRAILPLALASAFLHAALTPYFVFAQSLFDAQQVSVQWIGAIFAAVELSGGLSALLAERVAQRYSLPTAFRATIWLLIACLAANALGMPAASIPLFFVAMSLPEVVVVLVDEHLQARIPSRIRASLLSAFSFLEVCITGVSYLLGGLLIQGFGQGLGIASLALFPAVALVLASVYFRRSALPAGGAEAPQAQAGVEGQP